jgi:hypothetical protein
VLRPPKSAYPEAMNTPGWMVPVILVLVGFLVILALVNLLS